LAALIISAGTSWPLLDKGQILDCRVGEHLLQAIWLKSEHALEEPAKNCALVVQHREVAFRGTCGRIH
jgi:hypothetical protein